MWAAYNFWCHPEIDTPAHCTYGTGRWTDIKYHYRSAQLFHETAQLFHEMILAKSLGEDLVFPIKSPFDPASKGYYRDYATKFWAAGINGTSTLIFIANEQLAQNTTAVWHKFTSKAQFTDDNIIYHPHTEEFSSIRVNTGT